MTRRQRFAAAGAALALVVAGGGVAYAATGTSRAACTPDPVITTGSTTQSVRVTCSWPLPAPVTSTVTSTVTQTVTASPTASPTTTTTPPPGTTTTTSTPSTTTPEPTTTTAPPGPTTITNGSQITTANTGWLAWRDTNGDACTNPRVYSASVDASTLGGSAVCAWFKGGIVINAPVILTAVRIDDVIRTYGASKLTLRYATVRASSPGDYAAGTGNIDALRSQFTGSSDGVRIDDGNVTLVECWVRTKLQDPADHNDGVQAYRGASGSTFLRNNIDARPENGDNSTTTAAMFIADDSRGEYVLRDNYLAGGGYTLRLHESGTYRITGNIIAKGTYSYGPLSTSNAVAGAFLEWSGNTLSDGTALNR